MQLQYRTHEMKSEIVKRNLSGAEFIFIKLINMIMITVGGNNNI